MALDSGTVSVAATPTLISFDTNSSISIFVQNLSAQDVYLGDSGVSTTTGVKLTVGGTANYELLGGDQLYGVVASSTAVVRVNWLGINE